MKTKRKQDEPHGHLGKDTSGGGNSRCKGPETGMWLARLKKSKQAAWGTVIGDEGREGGRVQIMQGFVGPGKDFCFSYWRVLWRTDMICFT